MATGGMCFVLAVLALACNAAPASAGPGGDALRDALYAGTLAQGIETLTPMAAGGDAEARFGLGMLQFLQGFEGLAQALYRYGLASPEAGPMAPVFGVPVPPNASPEPIDYDKFRAVLAALGGSMDTARATLVDAGDAGGEWVVKVDLAKVRFDINGDGKADDSEAVGRLFGAMAGEDGLPGPAEPPSPQPGEPVGADTPTSPPAPSTAAAEATTFGFDRADAYWLAGYSEIFAMQGDLLLAHDFSEFFNVSFHRLFPHAGLLMQRYSRNGTLFLDPETDTAIADAVAAIHTLNWPVIEPKRLKGILARASAVTALSRKDWAAILQETDDDAELLPSPRQTGPGGEKITQEQVDAWLATLDQVDKIIAGELLLPHWRFAQGFDLRAYFETAKRTDLVMLLTGAGAIPYLKDGPIADTEAFAAANRAFGENLIGYAFWFN